MGGGSPQLSQVDRQTQVCATVCPFEFLFARLSASSGLRSVTLLDLFFLIFQFWENVKHRRTEGGGRWGFVAFCKRILHLLHLSLTPGLTYSLGPGTCDGHTCSLMPHLLVYSTFFSSNALVHFLFFSIIFLLKI